ncbi:hypothetical protein HOY80DRAFT_943057 [Tuber brumale]|nr:hypothetical protein HOY80DRAFT_943057 [Tuber brumale]
MRWSYALSYCTVLYFLPSGLSIRPKPTPPSILLPIVLVLVMAELLFPHLLLAYVISETWMVPVVPVPYIRQDTGEKTLILDLYRRYQYSNVTSPPLVLFGGGVGSFVSLSETGEG